jgi:O-antigen ligase
MVGGAGVAGSLVSFLYVSAIVLGLWRLALGLIAIPRDRAVRLIGAAFAARFAAESVSTLVNYREPLDLYQGILSNVPFLGFLIVFGRLSLTPRADVLRWVERGAMGGAIGAGLLSMAQVLVFGMPRAEGLAGNPGPFGLVCTVLFGYCLGIAMYRRGKLRRIAAAAAIMAAVGLILSGMRSLWPMLVISPPLLAWMIGFVPRRLVSPRLAVVGMAAAVLVAMLGYGTVHERVVRLFADVELVADGSLDNSLGQRIRVWSAALDLIRAAPVFGQGPANVPQMLHDAAQQPGETEIYFTHAHNLVLNALARSGIFGLAAVVAMFAVPLWVAGRAEKDLIGRIGYAMMVMLCVTYLVNGSFNVSFGHDILDATYIYAILTMAYLVFGASGSPRFALFADGARVPANRADARETTR